MKRTNQFKAAQDSLRFPFKSDKKKPLSLKFFQLEPLKVLFLSTTNELGLNGPNPISTLFLYNKIGIYINYLLYFASATYFLCVGG